MNNKTDEITQGCNPIYLDNAATTKTMAETFEAALWAMHDTWGNPSSLHNAGREAAKKVQKAREQIARAIGAFPDEIIFTSGGSESDNLALRGIAPFLKESGRTTIITSLIEHHAVLNTCRELEQEGFLVVYMPVDEDGRVDIEELERVMDKFKDSVGLVSIMAVNNETGVIQLIDDIGDLCQEYGALFMTDAVQALGHIPLDVGASHIDLMAMSGHKIHALKGIGALYVSRGLKLKSIITGGNQEGGLRAGTENVPGIVSMGEAVDYFNRNMNAIQETFAGLRTTFLDKLNSLNIKYNVNCPGVDNIISLTLPNCESEAMLLLLNEKGVYVSAGSACTAGMLEPSHVLKAMYLSEEDASCTIRVSMSLHNSTLDMIQAAQAISDCVKQLHSMI